MRNILAAILWISLLTPLGASEPVNVSFKAVDDQTEQRYVHAPVVPKILYSSVSINGKSVLPAHGSTAGVWFYAEGDKSTQLLLSGHTETPESWRMTMSINAGDEIRISFRSNEVSLAHIQFRVDQLSQEPLIIKKETNVLVFTTVSGPAVARFSHWTLLRAPVTFNPQRRPFSRNPVIPSPEMDPAIANALIEWDWRMQDGIHTPRETRTYGQAVQKILRLTEELASARLKSAPFNTDEQSIWNDLRAARSSITNDASISEEQWLEIHRIRRKFILTNPLFKLPPLLFVKHVPSVMSHQLTQTYGYCSRPGGGIYVLSEPGGSMSIRNITPASLPAGNFMTADLSFNAKKLLFAYCPVKEAPVSWDFNEQTKNQRYHICELSLDTGSVRTLTQGDNDNFSPVYLPSGDILYVSTQRGGFHRCGRGPCFVYTLSRMAPDGQNPHSISFHETHEWDPCLLNDGRVIYTRWDYVDRNAVYYENLWSARPDGSNVRIYYGNNTWNPVGIWEARSIPGSTRIMATASPHHGMSAGSIILVDTAKEIDGKAPLTRLTPEVRFPESEFPLAFGPNPAGFDFDTPVKQYWTGAFTEAGMQKTSTDEEKRWPGHCYKSPWPLSEKYFIVSYSFDQLVGEPGPNIPNMFGLYFADAFGNKELIYRDPAISSLWARPLESRTPPPDIPAVASDANEENGTFFLSNVMESWPHLPVNSSITHLRIIQVLVKTTPNADSPKVGAAFAAPGKQVLGTVPVEKDGSAYFKAPARTPLMFQALDNRGRAVQTMRSLVYLQPGENQSCIGCHEHRMKHSTSVIQPLASLRAPSEIKPGPDGTRPFSYPRLVQPILNRHCVKCHDGKDPKICALTGESEGDFTKSYNALVKHVSYSAWNRPQQNFEPMTEPLRFGVLGSPLAQLLEKGHGDVVLTVEDQERLFNWMDANALFYGTFDVREQKKQLIGEAIQEPKM